ncbi:MAG: uracil-DNA glycosylase [Candidatus Babeliales bacterium]|jgi:DNA polymerase
MDKKTPHQHLLNYLIFASEQPKGFVYRSDSALPQEALSTANADTKQQLESLFLPNVHCTACPLATQGRSHVVCGHGNPHAQLMFVGEGPGRDEDEQGLPFVGRAGQLLTKIIEAMKLKREDVYISNVVKCRPPGNRAPLPIESDTCKKLLLFREIDIIKPTLICTLGATAVQAVLGDGVTITRARGTFYDYKGIPVMPTYHPAYLLRNPDAKRVVWEDMKKIMERLEHINI